MRRYFSLFLAILIPELVGVLGSFFTVSAIYPWYNGLQKSALSPPNWVFGPVWSTLYLLMGVSSYLVWKNGLKGSSRKLALEVYLAQLVINLLWSIVFFGFHQPGYALLVLVLLWVLILLNIIYFYKLHRAAGILLVPYFIWVTFAGYLNYSVWNLNVFSERAVKAEIKKANYCTVTDDCVVVDSKCPFDCMVVINIREKERINKLIDGYKSNCVYGCAIRTGAECQNGRCVLKK